MATLATPQVFSSLSQIVLPFKGILLDAHGVFWESSATGLIAGSAQSMEKLVSSGKIVGILSNSTQLSSYEMDKFRRHGLELNKHYHFILTSGEVAKQIFKDQSFPFPTSRKKFWLFSSPHPKFSSPYLLFEGSEYQVAADLEDADFVYLGIPHIDGVDQTDPECFRSQLELIASKNLPVICANPDCFAQEGDPPKLVVRQGSLAKMYEEMGGLVFYIGKPHLQVYKVAIERFGAVTGSQLLMVGDTPETDIRGARSAGIASALLTKTGIFCERVARQGFEKALQKLSSGDIPDYFVEKLADGI